jgi:(1->4)-alpha-D-glucan 1-alpha-D-glucosylmutase
LSERPQAWNERLARWLDAAAPLRTGDMPDRADVAMLLQTIVGCWPFELALDDAVGRAAFAQRLEGWEMKALREAKRHTDWSDADAAYERAARRLLRRLLVEDDGAALRAELFAFVEEIAPAGAINSLAQTLLRLTVPGVPDLYEGTELWDLSLVDPDNRTPVDFALRQELLGTGDSLKQMLIVRALGLRKAMPELFVHGSYEPVAVEGPLADHVIAFLRRHEVDAILVVAPRLPASLKLADLPDATLPLPTDLQLISALEEGSDPIAGPDVALQQIWRRWPVALLSTRRPFAKQDLPRK